MDFEDIWSKTKLVLTPSFRAVDERLVEGSDLAGPAVFALLLAGALVLRGKLHFGYVYGFGLSSCVATYVLLNLMHQDGGVAFGTVVSFFGYCLLPVVLLAAASIVVSSSSVPGQVLGGLAVLASTCTSTRLFEAKLHMRPQRCFDGLPARADLLVLRADNDLLAFFVFCASPASRRRNLMPASGRRRRA